MGQQQEGSSGHLHKIVQTALRGFRRQPQLSTGEVVPSHLAQITQPSGEPHLQLPSAPELKQLPAPSARELRLLQHRVSPPGSDIPVPTKRRHFRSDRPIGNTRAVRHERREDVPQGRSLVISPRFRNDFDDLPPEGRREVKDALLAIAEGRGHVHKIHDVKGGVKLYTGREHTGGRDDRRIIFLPVNGNDRNFYALAILPSGHDYGRSLSGLITTAQNVPKWVESKKMVEFEAWLKSLT